MIQKNYCRVHFAEEKRNWCIAMTITINLMCNASLEVFLHRNALATIHINGAITQKKKR